MAKTDLSKILSVSGYPGLYRFLAQSRTGVIAENLADGKRVNFPANGKITTLQDIAIYTDEGEMKLSKVFLALKEALGTDAAVSAKASPGELQSLFRKAVPDYDGDRFYLSHMKKVVSWYSLLKDFASLDFEEEKEG